MNLATLDPAIHSLIVAEEKRQREKIRLIASENYVSQAVMASEYGSSPVEAAEHQIRNGR